MKQFVIGGLDTPQKKSEAEAILMELGYESVEEWNESYREEELCSFIATYNHGFYMYHTHKGFQTPVTLDELRTMKNQEK